jgi:hypothetical protein
MSLVPRPLLGDIAHSGHILGGKETLGGLERWFIPRGQDLAFLLSCIGLVRPSSSVDLKQNKTPDISLVTARKERREPCGDWDARGACLYSNHTRRACALSS